MPSAFGTCKNTGSGGTNSSGAGACTVIPASVYLGRAASLAGKIVKELTVQKKMIAAAESCTAGLASDFIARIPGASAVLWGSFVTYTVNAKIKMLGVPGELIQKFGAVSKPVALAMAEAALERSGAWWAFSITGLAGPTGSRGTDGSNSAGGDSEIPVGTIWIGISGRDGGLAGGGFSGSAGQKRSESKMFLFSGSRNEVREAAAAAALEELLARIQI